MNKACTSAFKNLQCSREGAYIALFTGQLWSLRYGLPILTFPCPPYTLQVAKAVNNATAQSLVLIDEFGKGTNTVRGETDEGRN